MLRILISKLFSVFKNESSIKSFAGLGKIITSILFSFSFINILQIIVIGGHAGSGINFQRSLNINVPNPANIPPNIHKLHSLSINAAAPLREGGSLSGEETPNVP